MSKGKFEGSEGVVAETGKWNSSRQYSELMIMKLLYECNEYQSICYHGTSEILEDLMIGDEEKARARLSAIKRYITTLRMLVSNTIKQIKATDTTKFEFFQTKLGLLYNSLPILENIYSNQNMKGNYQWVEVNEKAFTFILDEIIAINEKVSGILTENDLVYYNIREFNEDVAKQEFMKKFEEEG